MTNVSAKVTNIEVLYLKVDQIFMDIRCNIIGIYCQKKRETALSKDRTALTIFSAVAVQIVIWYFIQSGQDDLQSSRRQKFVTMLWNNFK